VLEIGCGTGQATVPLAERGYRIVAVELGTDMAAVARRNLAAFDAVEVVTAAFEEWPLPGEPFDVVFSATAFHWIDPAVRVSKSADALRPGGLLATVATHHIAGGTWNEAFFADIQRCYERFDPSTPPELNDTNKYGTGQWTRCFTDSAVMVPPMDGILLPVLQGSGPFPITSLQRVTTLIMRNQMGAPDHDAVRDLRVIFTRKCRISTGMYCNRSTGGADGANRVG